MPFHRLWSREHEMWSTGQGRGLTGDMNRAALFAPVAAQRLVDAHPDDKFVLADRNGWINMNDAMPSRPNAAVTDYIAGRWRPV